PNNWSGNEWFVSERSSNTARAGAALYNLHDGLNARRRTREETPGKSPRAPSPPIRPAIFRPPHLTRRGGPGMSPSLNIRTLLNSWFGENTYVVWRPGGSEALVIDPGIDLGLDLTPLTELLNEEGLTVAAILNTHGHGDHIGGNQALKRAYPTAPLVIGEKEKHLLTDSDANLSAPFGFPIVSPMADRTVREGEVLEYAGIRLEV